MKRTILLITMVTITFLLLPMALFAELKYLAEEGSSSGIQISPEAIEEAKAREARFLQYQSAVEGIKLNASELQTTTNSHLTNVRNATARGTVDVIGVVTGQIKDAVAVQDIQTVGKDVVATTTAMQDIQAGGGAGGKDALSGFAGASQDWRDLVDEGSGGINDIVATQPDANAGGANVTVVIPAADPTASVPATKKGSGSRDITR